MDRIHLHTPRVLERRFGYRESLHFFPYGIHYKRRTGRRWRHGVIKVSRGSVFGHTRGRTMLWVGWWTSQKGQRGNLNGFRLAIALDHLPKRPTPSMRIPFFAQRTRDRKEPFEIR